MEQIFEIPRLEYNEEKKEYSYPNVYVGNIYKFVKNEKNYLIYFDKGSHQLFSMSNCLKIFETLLSEINLSEYINDDKYITEEELSDTIDRLQNYMSIEINDNIKQKLKNNDTSSINDDNDDNDEKITLLTKQYTELSTELKQLYDKVIDGFSKISISPQISETTYDNKNKFEKFASKVNDRFIAIENRLTIIENEKKQINTSKDPILYMFMKKYGGCTGDDIEEFLK